MTSLIVEHEWKDERKEDLFKIVGQIVEMQKTGNLPDGFSLKSINVIGGENRAICAWDAPSTDAMKELLGNVNPPSNHRVSEVSKVF